MKHFPILATLLFAMAACSPKPEILFTEGTGMVPFECVAPFEGDTLEIHYYIPQGDLATMPIQVVIPGMGRNADGYRDAWIEKANEYGFAVIVPLFLESSFPERVYQQGNVLAEDGQMNAQEDFIYPVIGQVFDFFVKHSESNAKSYNIYGHSAGGQFVHRYLILGRDSDLAKVDKAIAANPGWYTFPSDTTDYPYALGQALAKFGLDKKAYYAKDLTILLGDADTLRTDNLRQTPEADAQGMTRLARGEKFFSYCQNDAAAMGVPFNWKKVYVPGVGHSNTKMAPAAADAIY